MKLSARSGCSTVLPCSMFALLGCDKPQKDHWLANSIRTLYTGSVDRYLVRARHIDWRHTVDRSIGSSACDAESMAGTLFLEGDSVQGNGALSPL